MDGNDTETDATADEFVSNVRASLARDRFEGCELMRLLRRLWKRHVTETPDRYRAYVTFPTEPDTPSIAEIHDRIGELERVFEGRLDVYARLKGISVVTDSVPARGFDADAFARTLEGIEADYAETHTLAHLEKWRPLDDHLVKSVVAVPVKPLFPRKEPGRTGLRARTG